MQLTSVTRTGGTVKMEIKAIAATYEGTLSPDLKTMSGTFVQTGNRIPLVLKRWSPPKSLYFPFGICNLENARHPGRFVGCIY
jgi:hypothetical protein